MLSGVFNIQKGCKGLEDQLVHQGFCVSRIFVNEAPLSVSINHNVSWLYVHRQLLMHF